MNSVSAVQPAGQAAVLTVEKNPCVSALLQFKLLLFQGSAVLYKFAVAANFKISAPQNTLIGKLIVIVLIFKM